MFPFKKKQNEENKIIKKKTSYVQIWRQEFKFIDFELGI